MARLQVDLISDGMAQLLKADGVRAFVGGLADQVLARAVDSAPVRTGEYRDSLTRESVTTDRAVERVVATAPHALLVESRTGNLARALGQGATGAPAAAGGFVMYTTRSGKRRRATAAQAAAWKASRKAP